MAQLFSSFIDLGWANYLASGIEAAAAIIIGVAAIQATFRGLLLFALRATPPGSIEGTRLRLARWLSLALELEVAADIIRTAISPNLQHLAPLAAIIVLRTVLNFSLERDIEKAQQAGITSQT